jgi:hypothetical protein
MAMVRNIAGKNEVSEHL